MDLTYLVISLTHTKHTYICPYVYNLDLWYKRFILKHHLIDTINVLIKIFPGSIFYILKTLKSLSLFYFLIRDYDDILVLAKMQEHLDCLKFSPHLHITVIH